MSKRGEPCPALEAKTGEGAGSCSGATTSGPSETANRCARAVRERAGASPRPRSAASKAGSRTTGWLCALAHAEQPPLDHLDGVGLQVGEQEEQPIFRRCQRAGPVHGEPTGGPRFPIEAPRRHMVLERGLEGRHQNLKLLQGQTGEIEELRRASLHVSEPYSSHGSCLLSRHGSITDSPFC